MNNKILTIVGARPQFIKASAISRAISKRDNMREVIVHTGQHFDAGMSDVFFEELSIPTPDYNLEISGGTHGRMTGRMLEGVEKVILTENPDIVLVYGDTNSTLAGALSASKLCIPVAHVEAGLRSFNRHMPEEINRVMTDHISDLLFCPTQVSVENLEKEGITKGVFHVGDVMYDSTLFSIEKAKLSSNILSRLSLNARQYGLATIHRAENTDTKENLNEVLDWLKQESKKQAIVLPLHPRTKAAATKFGLNFDGLELCEPLGYLDMACLLSAATTVYTDSGGLQKEAYFHGKPCITLREETEWVETIENGWNRLWKNNIVKEKKVISEYGKGDTASEILSHIENFLAGV